MKSSTSYAGQVQRIDALLRSRFPNLITRIYEVEPDRFVIVFDATLQDATTISEEFDQSIRFLTVAVTLSNTPPETYLREIPVLSDAEAAGDMTGLPLRRFDFLNLLLSRFPDSDILAVRDDPKDRKIILSVQTAPDAKTESQLIEFVNSFNLPLTVKIEISPSRQQDTIPEIDDPMFVWASRLRPNAPTYVRQDEAFWFDNIGEISSNHFPIERFPGIQDNVFRCYFDLTLGEEHMNLRQALLFYDEIWCSPPLAQSQDTFLESQGLTKDDLLTMVDAGRLRFVTTQPEERLDIPFLEAVFEHNTGAILGRRTTAALLVADVAQTAEQSLLNDPSLFPVLGQLVELLAAEIGVDPNDLLRIYLWPLMSQRGGLQGLLYCGSKDGPALSLAKVITARAKTEFGVDIGLETSVFSEIVHIGHTLNATILGPLNEPKAYHLLKSEIGRHLNFHRNFNHKSARSWARNEVRRANGLEMLPAVPLFEFDSSIPIQEIIADSALGSTRRKGRSLYARLVKLPHEARQEEIENLVSALRNQARRESGIIVDLDTLDTAAAVASLLLDFISPPLAGLKDIGERVIEKLRRRSSQIDQIIAQLESTFSGVGGNQELDFLSRISRVATFRRERI